MMVSSKKTMIQTLFLIWILWFIGNLCANALFYLGMDFKPYLPTDMRNFIYPLGIIIYFMTVSMVGIIGSFHFINKWQLSLKWLPEKKTMSFFILSLILAVIMIGLGIMAMTEEFNMTLSDMFSQDLVSILSPLILLIPTMFVYTIMWYGLFLKGLIKVFGHTFSGKMFAILFTSFIYAVYHFASINEIHSLSAIFEEVLITFGISVLFATYVVLTDCLLIAFIVNTILNWLIFTPVETFHTSPSQWLFSYGIIAVILLIYKLFWGKDVNQERC